MKNIILVLLVMGLGMTGVVDAKVAGVPGGESPESRIALGILIGLAGVLPATAAVFGLLTAMFCHPERSKFWRALIGAVIGSIAYAICVLIGSVTLGPFLEINHPLRPLLAQWLLPVEPYMTFEFMIGLVFFLPAMPLAIWSMWLAHSKPAGVEGKN